MNRVTRADRVTSEVESEDDRVTPVVGKTALCKTLGWSRPALNRRLNWDKNFPVLHCGKPGDAWQFDLHAVLAHVESNAGRRGRPVGSTGRPSGVTVLAISRELERARAIRAAIAELVFELGTLLERMDAAIGFEAGSPTAATARRSVDGDGH